MSENLAMRWTGAACFPTVSQEADASEAQDHRGRQRFSRFEVLADLLA
jgi:hypothetical protein